MDPEKGAFSKAWHQHRGYLINIAYRLVGSVSEAEDMAQEAYARLLRADLNDADDVRGWLVVVVTRLCLDQLRSERTRHETNAGPWLPEPLVQLSGPSNDPADIVTLDESVRMALLIVLERMTPAERVVFVLHDVFDYSFEEVAPMVDRTPAACRQLASRARRRISADTAVPRMTVDPLEMRRVADRFCAAITGGELQPLLEVLDPRWWAGSTSVRAVRLFLSRRRAVPRWRKGRSVSSSRTGASPWLSLRSMVSRASSPRVKDGQWRSSSSPSATASSPRSTR